MSTALELLKRARQRYTQAALADLLKTSPKTIARWEQGISRCPPLSEPALREILGMGRDGAQRGAKPFTFVDLFAGIGGTRLGFEAAGGECVFTSEWNEWSRKTYLEYFGHKHPFAGDITKVDPNDVPDHDVLVAGFPCQPFSLAGVSKKNSLGRAHGFECTTQGTLFFDIQRILEVKRPKAFLLENVKNLVGHDKGNTFAVIRRVLEDELGYKIHYKVVDGKYWVPQHRERILIVGFSEPTDFTWDDLQVPLAGPPIKTILHPEDGSESPESHFTEGPAATVSPKYTLSTNLWEYLQKYAAKHAAAGNGFGFGLVRPDVDQCTRTLSARYHKDGSEILIYQKRKAPRRLTPRECARLMGFPEDFRIVVSDTQAYRQFGNSVVVPVIAEVARIMAPRILELKDAEREGVRQERLLIA